MPDRWATDDFISALNRYGVLEVDDENGVATIISHIDVVTEVDSASLINRRLDQLPSLLHGNRNDSIHVGQIATLVVLGVNVVVKIEKVARHSTGMLPQAQQLRKLTQVRSFRQRSGALSRRMVATKPHHSSTNVRLVESAPCVRVR